MSVSHMLILIAFVILGSLGLTAMQAAIRTSFQLSGMDRKIKPLLRRFINSASHLKKYLIHVRKTPSNFY